MEKSLGGHRSLLPAFSALCAFSLAMLPWFIRGQLSHPPLTVEQYLSPSLWTQVLSQITTLDPLAHCYEAFAPLVILVA